ncbi:hypothetical protein [Brachybacterium hainanense]|uniref:Uncharacterized protein n=1 Tax=Brachybacterium hainanense TaxID=1541174 RepID=A0ABV6REY6_9MICO
MTRPRSDPSPRSSPRDDGAPLQAPAAAWIRPALLLGGGLAVAVVLLLVDQRLASLAMALFALLMGYWTSPLRGGQHEPLAEALERRGPGDSIILWAPGDPMSARLQTAIRSTRTDVHWVNVYRDAQATAVLAEHGGRSALPLVLLAEGPGGEGVLRRASVGRFLDASAAAQATAAGGDGGEAERDEPGER